MRKYVLLLVWVLALIGVVLLSSSFSERSEHFFGIAEDLEQSISFQYPVEIVQFFVISGTAVTQGETILEVKRHQLDNELTMLDQELSRYELQKQETNNAMHSQLSGLIAQKQAVQAEMDYQIHSLELRLKTNTELMQAISGNPASASGNTTELEDLKRKRHFSMQAIQTEINHLQQQLQAKNHPIDAQIKQLLQNKQELLRQNTSLTVNAQFNGRIGNVNFKTGELVSPFQPIMSVHSRTPRYIKAYIHENILNDVRLGQTVWVQPISNSAQTQALSGMVESLGNRIVAYPERLNVNPALPTWGREVVVRLHDNNHVLLFGEKVHVFLQNPQSNSLQASLFNHANATTNSMTTLNPALIESSDPAIDAEKIEASGILWLPEQQHYLLISDEIHPSQSTLLILDKNHRISDSLALPKEIDIDDLESISNDQQYVYLLSSLSHNKNNKLKNKRTRLLRFRYQQSIKAAQEINLYKVIKTLADEYKNTALGDFLKHGIKQHSIDIESHYVHDNALFIGFKSPFQDKNKTIIIKIDDINAVFEGDIKAAQISLSVALLDPDTAEPMQLSDMLSINDDLLLLSVSRNKTKTSVLWHYQSNNETLTMLQQFPGFKAEGITYNPEQQQLSIVFDEGNDKHSRYQTLSWPRP